MSRFGKTWGTEEILLVTIELFLIGTGQIAVNDLRAVYAGLRFEAMHQRKRSYTVVALRIPRPVLLHR